jgi:hypothetical protein
MSKWDYLDEEFEMLERVEKIRKGASYEGSLTEHLRYVEPNRNGAHKRDRELQRRMKEYN